MEFQTYRRLIRCIVSGFSLFAPVLSASVAQALVININPVAGGGLTTGVNAQAAMAAFNRAADRWESVLTDNITVQIKADLRKLGSSSVIGQAGSTMLQGSFDTVRNALVNDGLDEADDDILASLPTFSEFGANRPADIGLLNAISMTQANAMALGFARVTSSDATIEFNSGFSFDYDNTNGVIGMDFESVAIHEIGHALGFVSVVDKIDSMKANKQTGSVAINPVDLFRFGSNANPSTATQFKTYTRNLSPGTVGFFDDLDAELRLSTGYYTGDRRQASHWRDNALSGVLLGVMDPTLSKKAILPLSVNDIRVMDRIGWEYGGASGGNTGSAATLKPAAGSSSGLFFVEVPELETMSVDVPEPETLVLYVIGLAGMAFLRQRKKDA